MQITLGTISSIAITFGPFLLPRIIAYYRSIKNRPAAQIKPLPRKTSYALAVLFISGLVAFLSTFPIFAPENIFRLTQSRIHTSGGVLLTRLAALRPITPTDEKLRAVFDSGGLDARLLYALYGPDILLDITLGPANEVGASRNFLIYALPAVLTPHLLHLLALGIATSGMLSGREGSSWRTLATISGLVLATAELVWIANYDSTANSRSVRVNDIDFIHWKLAVWRGLAIAATDGLLGWFIWLQATGRAFLSPKLPAERLLDHAQRLEGVYRKLQGVGVLRNGAVRSGELRRRVDGYWAREGEVMKDVHEQPEVLEAQRHALEKLDTARIGKDVNEFLDGLLGGAESVAAT